MGKRAHLGTLREPRGKGNASLGVDFVIARVKASLSPRRTQK